MYPAGNDMFNEDFSKKLSVKEQEIFHRFTTKFFCKRAHLNIQPITAVLCTRVKAPDRNDWNKLVQMMKFLYTAREGVLGMSADRGPFSLHWYVDASFVVHPDLRSHSGLVGKFKGGKGSVVSGSDKQKLNTDSSTMAELVGTHQYLPKILYAPLFLSEQGYDVKENVVYQYNKSAILLETNGKPSSGKLTMALNIRYFLITDQVKKGNLKIK